MHTARAALLLGLTLALCACATAPAPTPVVGLPGPSKDIATFQKQDTACRQEASQAAHAGASANRNTQWQIFFDSYAHCETGHGNIVQPVPWAAAYADYLGTNTVPYAYAGYPYVYGYPYAYAGYPFYYGGPFLFGYPYPLFFGAGYGFGYGHFGYGHFGGGHFSGGFGFHGGGGRR